MGTKAAAFAFCYLKAKTAFSFIPKAVKVVKIQLLGQFIAFLTYEKFTAFLFAFEKQKISF